MQERGTIYLLVVMIGMGAIILGIMFGRLTHYFSTQRVAAKYTEEKTLEIPAFEYGEPTAEAAPVDSLLEEVEDEYRVCLMISEDYGRIKEKKDELASSGYEGDIEVTRKVSRTIYSLYLYGTYSREDATVLGEEVIEIVPGFISYWLESESSVSSKEVADEPVDITDDAADTVLSESPTKIMIPEEVSSDEYELQIMANTDSLQVDEKKRELEARGYPSKITTFTRDGITYYRLRLQETFNLESGKQTGDALKQQFEFVRDYWLEKVKKPRN